MFEPLQESSGVVEVLPRPRAKERARPKPLAEGALQGLAGRFIDVIGESTEADPAGLLVQFLTVFGNAIGRTAYFIVEEVSTRTIRRMVDRREIQPGVKLGSRKVWFSEMVLTFLVDRAQKESQQSRRLEK